MELDEARVRWLVDELDEPWRTVINGLYYERATRADIASRVMLITQKRCTAVKVSRLEAQALLMLQDWMEDMANGRQIAKTASPRRRRRA